MRPTGAQSMASSRTALLKPCASSTTLASSTGALRAERFRRLQPAHHDPIPIPQRRPQILFQKRAIGIIERQEARDDRRGYQLGGTAGAVIALHRKAEALLGQRAAEHAFGAGLDERACAE